MMVKVHDHDPNASRRRACMNILIAEDDPVTQHKLRVTLTKWGDDVVTACDGSEAWEIRQSGTAPASWRPRNGSYRGRRGGASAFPLPWPT